MQNIPKVRHIALAGILGSVSGVAYKYLKDDSRFRKQFMLCTGCAGIAGLAYGFIGARMNKVPHVTVTAVGNGMNGIFMSAMFLNIRKFLLEDHPSKDKLNSLLKHSFPSDINLPKIHPVPAAVISGGVTGATYSLFMWSGLIGLGGNVLFGAVIGSGAHFVYKGIHLLFLELAIRHNHPEVVKFPETVKKETWDEWIVRMAAMKTPVGELQTKIAELEIEYLDLQEKENNLLRMMGKLPKEEQNIETSEMNKDNACQVKNDTPQIKTAGTLMTSS